MYYLTKFDDIISIKPFLSCSKITSANSCKPIHDIIKYSTSIYPFESEKCAKKGKKIQNIENVKIEKSFLDEIKAVFVVFAGLSVDRKIKI